VMVLSPVKLPVEPVGVERPAPVQPKGSRR